MTTKPKTSYSTKKQNNNFGGGLGENPPILLAFLTSDKSIALTEVVDQEVADLGQWLLEELRELIHTLAGGDGDKDSITWAWTRELGDRVLDR